MKSYKIKIDEYAKYNDSIETIEACKILTGAAFKLYIYLTFLEKDTIFTVSPTNISEELNIAKNSVKNAFFNLLENNYLKKIKDNLFLFTGAKIGL